MTVEINKKCKIFTKLYSNLNTDSVFQIIGSPYQNTHLHHHKINTNKNAIFKAWRSTTKNNEEFKWSAK